MRVRHCNADSSGNPNASSSGGISHVVSLFTVAPPLNKANDGNSAIDYSRLRLCPFINSFATNIHAREALVARGNVRSGATRASCSQLNAIGRTSTKVALSLSE